MMDMKTARGLAAQAWCQPETENTEMDVNLAEAFAKILVGNVSGITVGQAMGRLSKEMVDDDYANGWHANLAVMMTDAGVEYDAAQERAAGFMRMVFDRDTAGIDR